MTFVEKIQKKADVIARRYKDDIDFIQAFAETDEDSEHFGKITVEIYEFGGPKMKNGKILGDHSSYFAECDLKEYLKRFGASISFFASGDDIEHHLIHTYHVMFGDFAKGETK